MKEIKNQTFPNERALYNINEAIIDNCSFAGKEDGESALKEAKNIKVINSYFDLRYPFWHVVNAKLNNDEMTSNCRAALWYAKHINIQDCKLHGIKAVRECYDVNIDNCHIVSPEFGWKNNKINLNNSFVESEYAFFGSKNIKMNKLNLKGKYSFQYVNNLVIEDGYLDTKDAFWHTKDVVVINSSIVGEYLGWYSKNLTLINCLIKGTQPLCYCDNLKLINCRMENTDLSFENSKVNATIIGNVESIKNVRSGKIIVDSCGEIINEDSPYPVKGKVIIRQK